MKRFVQIAALRSTGWTIA